VLYNVMALPLKLKDPLTSRVKIMAKLDIAEKRLPQDGRIKIKMKVEDRSRDLDFRVSCLPTLWGEKIVLRLLDRTKLMLDMTKLGFEPHSLDRFKRAIAKPYGIVLVTGPTGSGKSTTLASMIDHRNANKSGHILTFEDPIEFTFKNKRSIVNQRQVGTDTDSLAVGLKNAMRQAPDCILVGEIRDMETMSAAVAYAQSGHLVLSTLHANNANNALNRIISFYAPEHRRVMLADLAATLKAIVSQRLVRATDGSRLPAVELLLNTRHVSELIEQGRLTEVKEAMEKSLAPGSQTFEQALLALVQARAISREDALANADSPTNLLWLLENAGLAGPPSASGNLPLQSLPKLPEKEKEQEGASFSEFLLNI